MKLPESNIETSTGGVLDSKTFSIGNPAIILNILRTKIYTDPILAVCREIITNARDAHREVNTPDKPVEIEFPSSWEKNLRIKDYGPGISPSRMEDVFIKFGNSTKRTSNKQHGGFGIGAKSILAYSDSFSVETIVNGLKYTYSAYIDETQVGKMDLMGEPIKTDERNGTTIIIPIKQDDRRRFVDLIIEVTKHWKVKPILKGDHSGVYPTYTFSFEGEKWGYPDDKSAARTHGYSYSASYDSYAIVDGIQYTIRLNSLPNATLLHKALVNSGFHLYFNVGELTLSASRDNLYYDDDTQAFLLKRLDELADELVKLVSDQISGAKDYTEACRLFRDAKGLFNRAGLVDHLKGIEWKGNKIKSTISVHNDIGEWATAKRYMWDTYNNKVISNSRVGSIEFLSDNVELYQHDIKLKHVPSYLTEWMLQQDRNKIINVIATHDPPNSVEYHQALSRSQRMDVDPPVVKYDTDLLNLLNIKSLQEALDKVPKEEKKRQKRKKVEKEDDQILGYSLVSTINDGRFEIKSTAYDHDLGGVYVEVDYKDKFFYTENDKGDREIVGIPNLAKAQAFLQEPICGFSAARIKQLKKKGKGWRTFNQAVKSKLEEMKKVYSVDALKEAANNSQYFWHHYISKYSLSPLNSLFDSGNLSLLDNQDSPLIEWWSESEKHLKFLQSCQNFRNFLFTFEKDSSLASINIRKNSYTEPVGTSPSKCKDLYEKVSKRYPLLKRLSYADQSDILHYVNLVDSKEKE